ncbi:MAG: GHMP kinase [Gammaproteobacteria bacterium]|nr:GHMP kinase [Gammaproteobacteria bacterium]
MTERSIQIAAPARLHLGFVDLNGNLDRHFGSLGLTITGLDAVLTARPAATLEVRGVESARAASSASLALQALGETRGVALQVEQLPPSHAGLGSGTQLGLAVATACARLYAHDMTPRALAPALGRGERSGIGIAAFEGGGFIVDGGRAKTNTTAPVLSRLQFPDLWRILLIFDDEAQGLHGAAERNAFAALPPMSPQIAAEIARWCLVGLLPAIADSDFTQFERGVGEIQARIGRHFAPVQGGTHYTSPRVAEIVAKLTRKFGIRGAGQSSWGPTAFVFAPTEALATAMLQFGEDVVGAQAGLRLQLVSGCNHGASVLLGS